MLINLQSNQLAVGMFVILPNSLLDNPFWKMNLLLKNEKQIQKIIKAKIKEVKVDTEIS